MKSRQLVQTSGRAHNPTQLFGGDVQCHYLGWLHPDKLPDPDIESVYQARTKASRFFAARNAFGLVLNRKPVVIQEDGTPEYAALKAQQYYIMKDFQMAAKQLMRINNECTQAG